LNHRNNKFPKLQLENLNVRLIYFSFLFVGISLFCSKLSLKLFFFFPFLGLKIIYEMFFFIFEFNFPCYIFYECFIDSSSRSLNQIGYIDWHLINVGIVEGFNVFQRTLIIFSNKIDSNSFTAETSTTTNSMNVVFPI